MIFGLSFVMGGSIDGGAGAKAIVSQPGLRQAPGILDVKQRLCAVGKQFRRFRHRARFLSAVSVAALLATATIGDAAPAVAPGLADHRAVYEMKLSGEARTADLADVRGVMAYEWKDACDAWVTQQRIDMEYITAEGESETTTNSFSSWEAKNGSVFTFDNGHDREGMRIEAVKGSAQRRTAGPGVIEYTEPQRTTLDLPRDAYFPTAHTVELLRRAKAGEVVFSSGLFDGSDEEGVTEVNAIIGQAEPETLDRAVAKSPLVEGSAWRVRLAFFDPRSGESTPDYEMTIVINEQAVVTRLLIDYGEFSIEGRLKSIEKIAKPRC